MSQREADARSALLSIAANLAAMALEDGPRVEHMVSRYAWMYALSRQDRDVCARDVIDAARASFSTQQLHPAMARLASWRETAPAIAVGLGSHPVDWIDGDEAPVVERP